LIAYIMRRLSALIVILFGSSFIIYNLSAISGDPLEALRISQDPNAAQQILTLTRELQLDVPPPLRYFIWLKGVLGAFVGQVDFGMTRDAQSVTAAVAAAIPTTIRLVIGATVIAIILGITIGVVTALRQYSRFDYAMTFFAFLLFSLPIFWFAVLLKQYLAIGFNNFLSEPQVSPPWLLGLGLASGIFWASVIGGDRRKVWTIFAIAAVATSSLIWLMGAIDWFRNPGLGPIVIFGASIGIAFAVTHLSTGLSVKSALRSSLTMAVLGLVAYYPTQWVLDQDGHLLNFILLAVVTIGLAIGVSYFFAKIDRGPVIRTSILTSILIAGLILVDKFMQTWAPYMATDAINYRPVPTVGQVNDLLEPGNFWFTSLDIIMHMFLPTVALTLISFAGYIRYSRGSLLEVLNQDYIRTARAKGLTERTVIMRHAFRNTMIPLTTIMVVDFAAIIGGAIITERIFGWVGMGTLFNQAINTMDLNLLMGVFLVTATMSVLANLAADLLYSVLDPRIRVGK
jgi:peptide/nickel transport system permease protein